MKRRSFLVSQVPAASLLAAGIASGTRAVAEEPTQTRQYYELRTYHLRRGAQHDSMSEFLEHAWLPAMNRLGISPIGFFEVMTGSGSPSIYVLIPYDSLATLSTVDARLAADAEFQRIGSPTINAPSDRPPYDRMESSLMVAFNGMPRLAVPDYGARQADRFFELRVYENHSKRAHQKKIEMFNTGEIAIFHRTGLRPVFFGDTLIGQKQPELTYMLAFESMGSHDKNWKAFVADPEWKRLSTTPGYTDGEVVSSISNMFLRPTSYSQI